MVFNSKKKIAGLLVGLLSVLGVSSTAMAQEWPVKAVTFLNPFPAGGGTDAFARPLAAQLTEQLGSALAPFLQRQPAQRAHKGDRLDAFHRRIEPAFFGQVADQPADIMRAVMPEHAAHAFIGVNNAEQHPQGRGLARAVRAENAVDRAFGNGNIHPVDRARAVKAFDQPPRFDGQGARVSGNGGEACRVIARRWVIAYRHIHSLRG